MGQLQPLDIPRLKDGLHLDGDGLFLQVRGNARSWILRYTIAGKNRYLGLGATHEVPLKDARLEAGRLRAQIEDVRKGRRGAVDPAIERQQAREAAKAAKPADVDNGTFRDAAKEYIRAHRTKWTNAKHAWQWEQTLERAFAVFGDVPVKDIARAHVLDLLRPLWRKIPETARRLRGRIEAVLDFAEANGWRTEANPARFKPISMALGDQDAVVKPHPSLPYARMPEFMLDLRGRDTKAARALELLILTATRGSEVAKAEWREIEHNDDWTIGTLTIPKEREGRKGKKGQRRDHVIALSAAALVLLRKLHGERRIGDEMIFGITTAAIEKLIRTMNADRGGLPPYVDPKLDNRPVVPHGMRSSFRTWAFECRPNVPSQIAEMCLAHTVGSDVERAYMRSDGRDLRHALLGDWGAHCVSGDGH